MADANNNPSKWKTAMDDKVIIIQQLVDDFNQKYGNNRLYKRIDLEPGVHRQLLQQYVKSLMLKANTFIKICAGIIYLKHQTDDPTRLRTRVKKITKVINIIKKIKSLLDILRCDLNSRKGHSHHIDTLYTNNAVSRNTNIIFRMCRNFDRDGDYRDEQPNHIGWLDSDEDDITFDPGNINVDVNFDEVGE